MFPSLQKIREQKATSVRFRKNVADGLNLCHERKALESEATREFKLAL
jgi:hypothetical protein